jgi:hypothetical protein
MNGSMGTFANVLSWLLESIDQSVRKHVDGCLIKVANILVHERCGMSSAIWRIMGFVVMRLHCAESRDYRPPTAPTPSVSRHNRTEIPAGKALRQWDESCLPSAPRIALQESARRARSFLLTIYPPVTRLLKCCRQTPFSNKTPYVFCRTERCCRNRYRENRRAVNHSKDTTRFTTL